MPTGISLFTRYFLLPSGLKKNCKKIIFIRPISNHPNSEQATEDNPAPSIRFHTTTFSIRLNHSSPIVAPNPATSGTSTTPLALY